jgi:hypothetical protein
MITKNRDGVKNSEKLGSHPVEVWLSGEAGSGKIELSQAYHISAYQQGLIQTPLMRARWKELGEIGRLSHIPRIFDGFGGQLWGVKSRQKQWTKGSLRSWTNLQKISKNRGKALGSRSVISDKHHSIARGVNRKDPGSPRIFDGFRRSMGTGRTPPNRKNPKKTSNSQCIFGRFRVFQKSRLALWLSSGCRAIARWIAQGALYGDPLISRGANIFKGSKNPPAQHPHFKVKG